MRVVTAVLLILVLGGISGGIYAAARRADVLRVVAKSTVVVRADTEDGWSQGSGTVVGKSGAYVFILTCHHVIDGTNNITVKQTTARDPLPAWIELDDSTRDLTLLVAKTDLPVLAMAQTNPQLYDTVYLVGAPDAEEGSASEGMITEIDYLLANLPFYRVTNAVVMPGISGGTAVNTQGQLVGVPARGSSKTSQQGLLIPLPALVKFAEGYL